MPLQQLLKTLCAIFENEETGGNKDLSELTGQVEAYQLEYPSPNATNSQKIREVLSQLYEKIPFNNTKRRALWLAVLKTVLPLLILHRQAIGEWWDQIFHPFMNSPTQIKPILNDLKSILFYILIYHDEDEWGKNVRQQTATEICYRLVNLYLENAIEIFKNVETQNRRSQTLDCLTDILTCYGVQRPKELALCFTKFYSKPRNRIPILSVMVSIARRQGPRLYEIPQTGFFDCVLNSLDYDCSPIALSYSLSFVIMILPHICNDLGNLLYRLFCSFLRLSMIDSFTGPPKASTTIDWEVLPNFVSTYATSSSSSPSPFSPHEKANSNLSDTFRSEYFSSLEYSQLFTFLYALFPINFLEFLRDPANYAAIHGFTIPHRFNSEVILSKCIPLLSSHLSHQNFLSYTSSSELSDKSRWKKLDSTAIVALCNSLNGMGMTESNAESSYNQSARPFEDIGPPTGVLAYPNENHDICADSLSVSWHQQLSAPNSINSSFALEPTDLKGVVQAAADESSENDSQRASVSEASPFFHGNVKLVPMVSESSEDLPSNTTTLLLRLQRELLFLKNELDFEKYMRQQHIQNISKLRREHVQDMAVESERQKLLLTNKRYKAQIDVLTQELEQQRTESHAALNRRFQWETDCNNKLKAFREERKAWKSKEENLSSSVLSLTNRLSTFERAQTEIAYEKNQLELRVQLYKSKLDEFEHHNKLVNLPNRKKEVSNEFMDSAAMESSTILPNSVISEDHEKRMIESEQLCANLKSENLHLQNKIDLLTKDLEALNIVCEAKIYDLEKRLSSQATVPEIHGSFNARIDDYFARYTDVKEKYDELLKKFRNLESKFLDSQAELEELLNFQKPLDSTSSVTSGSGFTGIYHGRMLMRNESLQSRLSPSRRSTDTNYH
ncbi:hamartin [Schizosaccharomyces cryophilus OY26]|uniref:Hamartin n=1 Tax=Schizosaccharomyces cryophilus (strain OY26 / ATCC MYA-4695 / CBS 11777 / NBRC 106824 / NRRL Y48691) TaxID=653667 RepID=S9W6N9_SCHCR|nr:hamartin [Schizosaccharomyces cryophilus OY26]EPY54209.1 hamartin [Schizosaccharomyces cryophilus OY26]